MRAAAVEAIVTTLARGLAVSGGLVLVALIVMSALSIAGRALIPLGLGPVPGDFELVEAGCAFAVFAFLPWCQLNRGHVTVDVLMARMGSGANALVDMVANLLMTGAALVIAVQMVKGAIDKHGYQETTFILQFPIWWSYALSLIGAGLLVPISAWTVWRSIGELGRQR